MHQVSLAFPLVYILCVYAYVHVCMCVCYYNACVYVLLHAMYVHNTRLTKCHLMHTTGIIIIHCGIEVCYTSIFPFVLLINEQDHHQHNTDHPEASSKHKHHIRSQVPGCS